MHKKKKKIYITPTHQISYFNLVCANLEKTFAFPYTVKISSKINYNIHCVLLYILWFFYKHYVITAGYIHT